MDGSRIEQIAKNWRRPLGLFLTMIALGGLVGFLTDLSKVGLVVLGSLELLVIGAWMISRRLPRASKDKVGLAIVVVPEDDEDARKFASDFILEISRLLSQGTAAKTFQLIRVPLEFVSMDDIVNDDKLLSLRLRTRSAFLMFATVRVRSHGGSKHTVLDVKAMVGHGVVNDAVQAQLAKEFGELMPARVQLPSDTELLNFVVTGEWAVLVAKYIIGIAAAISGFLDYAETLYRDADSTLRNTRIKGSTIYAALRQRLPQRLAEIRDARARAALDRWLEDAREEYLEVLRENVELIPDDIGPPHITNMRAIAAFLCRRAVDDAIRLLNSPAMPRDVTWYYNMGFLHAYRGNMQKASQCYSKAVLMTHPPDLIARLESFISAILAIEPARSQLHYCLALLNKEVKGDDIRAAEELRLFLARSRDGEFVLQRKRAREWLTALPQESIHGE